MNRIWRRLAHGVLGLMLLAFAVSCIGRGSASALSSRTASTVRQHDWAPGSINHETERAYQWLKTQCAEPAGLDNVRAVLNSTDQELQVNTANLLIRLRQDGVVDDTILVDVIPVLAQDAVNGDTTTREKAIVAIANATSGILVPDYYGAVSTTLGETTVANLTRETIDALATSLASREGKIPEYSAHVLSSFGTQAGTALPALRQLLTDPDPATRLEAAVAAANVAPSDAAEAVPVIVEGLNNTGFVTLRQRGVMALALIGPGAAEATPCLLAMIASGDRSLGMEAAQTLGAIEPPEDQTISYLVSLLSSEDPNVRLVAVSALRYQGAKAVSAVSELERLRQEPVAEVRNGAADAIDAIHSAVPESQAAE